MLNDLQLTDEMSAFLAIDLCVTKSAIISLT